MPAPAKVIMDDLNAVAQALKDCGRFQEALDVHTLEEAANRAGHELYTWDSVAEHVRSTLDEITRIGAVFSEDTLELINVALSQPRNPGEDH